jgi:hypothetical protein
MAHAIYISSEQRDAIAREIGWHLEHGLRPTFDGESRSQIADTLASGNLRLAETLEIWTVILDKAKVESIDISQVAVSTGRLHHQLRVNGKATAFARTAYKAGEVQESNSDIFLSELSVSRVAENIDHALHWIEQNVNEDLFVRLLIIPGYYIHALWMLDEYDSTNKVLIVDAPPEYKTLKLYHLYDSSEFLELLLREHHSPGVHLFGSKQVKG